MIGRTLAHFEITAKLGEGGMGEVYRATDTRLGREVAIKVLPEALTQDEERLARFEREARALATFDHPNIAAAYGLEEADGKQLLVMQLAEGEDLSKLLARGPFPVEDTVAIALQVAQGLEAAHERGIIHRDLKPANVVLSPDGSVQISTSVWRRWRRRTGGGADPYLFPDRGSPDRGSPIEVLPDRGSTPR